jgi:hypothetical protein
MPKKTPTPDEYAKSMGFPNAAVMFAYQQRQHEMLNATTDVVNRAGPPKAQPPVHPVQGFLESLLQYLPLGNALHKAGDAMDGKK